MASLFQRSGLSIDRKPEIVGGAWAEGLGYLKRKEPQREDQKRWLGWKFRIKLETWVLTNGLGAWLISIQEADSRSKWVGRWG